MAKNTINCKDCPAYDVCKELCPAAEAYVNQDYVPAREKPISTLITSDWQYYYMLDNAINYGYIGQADSWTDMCEHYGLTAIQSDILWDYMDGQTYSQIARHRGVSRQYIRRVIHTIAIKLGIDDLCS